MRSLVVVASLCAGTTLAQSGAWGGYVTGWQPDPPRLGTNSPSYVGDTRLDPPAVTAPYVPTVYGWPAPLSFKTDEDVEREREEARLAQEQVLAEQQAQLEREQERERAAEAQRALEQQQLELQQQALAQQQAQALREEQARAAEREVKARELERERAETEKAARAGEQPDGGVPPPPPTRGPDIHRWVDDDGVVHYSTNPRP